MRNDMPDPDVVILIDGDVLHGVENPQQFNRKYSLNNLMASVDFALRCRGIAADVRAGTVGPELPLQYRLQSLRHGVPKRAVRRVVDRILTEGRWLFPIRD